MAPATALQRSARPVPPMLGSCSSLHYRAPSVYQTRALWWWGRQQTEWTAHRDECLKERLRIHQRLLRHRSSKMQRRRAMWEREAMSTAPASCWPWRMPGRMLGRKLQDIQNLSSAPSAHSKVEEHSQESAQHPPVTTLHRDFVSFKKAVDDAMRKKPYGALFGRRLQGPNSANSSSWISLSRIWDPREIKPEQSNSHYASQPARPTAPPPPPAAAASPPPCTSPGKTSPPSQSVAAPGASKQSEVEEEYVYDPISMRRIPKSKQNKLLSLFFCQHDLDVSPRIDEPKTYHHVHKANDSTSSKPVNALDTNKPLDRSRNRRFRDLRAASLGNSLATSAEFGGKFSPSDSSSEPQRRQPREEVEEPSDDTPLFYGTTYESRFADTLASRRDVATLDVPSAEPATGNAVLQVGIIPKTKKVSSKIQTSLDRLIPHEDPASSSVLQPALDRHLQASAPNARQNSTVSLTDEAVENHVETVPSKSSAKLEIVPKHVQRRPAGIVAKPINSLGLQHVDAPPSSKDIEPANPTSGNALRSNLHQNIVDQDAKPPSRDLSKMHDDHHIQQQPLELSQRPHPLSTATVTPGVPCYPVIHAHISNFEPRLAKLADGAKDLERQIHQARTHYRQLKQQIQALPRPDHCEEPVSPSFSMLKEDPVDEPYVQSLDGPLTSAIALPDLKSGKVTQSAPSTQKPMPISLGVTLDQKQASCTSGAVDSQSLSAPYVVLRYNSSSNTVNLLPLTEPLPNGNSSLGCFDRLDHAANFFSFFPLLLKQGYEVVSGKQDQILFKRSGSGDRASVRTEQEVKSIKPSFPSETILLPAPNLAKPPLSPAAAARLKEHQDLTSTYIGMDHVKYSHGLNNFEVHSVLSRLAASVRKGKQEGADGLSAILERLKALRSKASTMDPVQFNKQADALIKEVQVARAAVPVKQVTSDAPTPSSVAGSTEAQKMYAATVLDEIPMPVPTPGPAAPTAPPPSPPSPPPSGSPITQPPPIIRKPQSGECESPESTSTPNPIKLARQDQSEPDAPLTSQQPLSPPGLGPRARPQAHRIPSPTNPLDNFDQSEPATQRQQPWPNQEEFTSEAARETEAPRIGVFRRFTRLVKKTILTIIAAGSGAYLIGMIAESVGAEAQKANAGDEGPRKKIVLPPQPPSPPSQSPSQYSHRQRPGIFSTESSR